MLIMVSFLLHVITLSAIYMLFKEVQKLKSTTYIEDIDELMTTYLDEFREENVRLENRLVNQERKSVNKAPEFEADPDENKNIEADQSVHSPKSVESKQPSGFAKVLYNEEKRQEPDNETFDIPLEAGEEKEDTYIASLQSRILQLAEQGMSPAAIAKRLDCGATEVELVIKMHKRTGKG